MPIGKGSWNRQGGTAFTRVGAQEGLDQSGPWPVLPSEEKAKLERPLLDGWGSTILQFPHRMLVTPEIDSIETLEVGGCKCRIYPPISLVEGKAVAALYEGIQYPIGDRIVERYEEIVPGKITDLNGSQGTEDGSVYCHAIRLDAHSLINRALVIRLLVEQVVLFTWQWWLLSPQTPFSGPTRFFAHIHDDFLPQRERKFRGAVSYWNTWNPALDTQLLQGIERPVSKEIWSKCIDNLRRGIPADRGLLFFVSAIAHYMADDDVRCIIDLAIAFEVMTSKVLLRKTGKAPVDINDAVKISPLVDPAFRDVIEDLRTDRGHVAHGKDAVKACQGGSLCIENYLEVMRGVVARYIESVSPDEWDVFAKLSINQKKLKSPIRKS